MTPRAAPMTPDDRRQAIVDVVVPLLLEHGRGVTTRQVAESAGIAEGTIFRVFDSKDALIGAALSAAFDPGPLADRIEEVDATLPLRERLVAATTILQERFAGIFSLMTAVGMVGPPEELDRSGQAGHAWRARSSDALVALIEPDRDELRVPPAEVVRILRLLTFSGSHLEIADHRLLTPEEIVDVVLHGTCLPAAAGRAPTTRPGD